MHTNLNPKTPEPKLNQSKLDAFFAAYEKNLAVCVEKFPTEYAYAATQVALISARMKAAVAANSFNKDSRAMKMTFKELGIPYTYQGINTYLERRP